MQPARMSQSKPLHSNAEHKSKGLRWTNNTYRAEFPDFTQESFELLWSGGLVLEIIYAMHKDIRHGVSYSFQMRNFPRNERISSFRHVSKTGDSEETRKFTIPPITTSEQDTPNLNSTLTFQETFRERFQNGTGLTWHIEFRVMVDKLREGREVW